MDETPASNPPPDEQAAIFYAPWHYGDQKASNFAYKKVLHKKSEIALTYVIHFLK